MLGDESPVRVGERGEVTVSPDAKELIRQARDAEESARSARHAAERMLKGEDVSEAPEGGEVDTGRVWWDTFVHSLTKGWADSMSSAAKASPSPATPGKSKRASAKPTGPRRLYPSGTLSLVPADYVPPPPDHAIIWDGVLGDRQVHSSSVPLHPPLLKNQESSKCRLQALRTSDHPNMHLCPNHFVHFSSTV